MEAAFARLEGRNFEYYMNKRRVTIGRNSKLGEVDVNMGASRFISRKHFEITLDRNCFFLLCRGKNGVFVDDVFQRRENKRMALPSSCIIRFPSTQIKLAFTSLLDDLVPSQIQMPSPMLPLRIDTTPLQSPFVSPMPSPTGTISAINSCPTSPSGGDYRHRLTSFDFMTKYAQKLLSSQSDSSEPPSDANNTAEEEEGMENEVKARVGGHSEGVTPVNQASNEQEEEECSGIETKALDKSHTKPPYSYAQLIVQALLAAKDHRQTLSNIYNFIAEQYPYYKLEDKGWKNSIRHNLSLNQYFMKAPREKEGLGFGKGGYWCMHPDYEEKLSSQAYVKRKKKGIPVFPSAGLISRSAPPSPTHHPLMHTEFNPRELEAKFSTPVPTPPSSHYSLQPFFPQLAGGSSHSLPASPSRTNPPFGTVKFFQPLMRSTSTEALALERSRKVIEPLREERREEPAAKRQKMEDLGERLAMISEGGPGGAPSDGGRIAELVASAPRPIQVPTITPLQTLPQGPPGSGVQFLSIPLMSSAGVGQQPRSLLSQPLSSFFPQSFFTGVATNAAPGSAQPPPPPPRPNNIGAPSNMGDGEG